MLLKVSIPVGLEEHGYGRLTSAERVASILLNLLLQLCMLCDCMVGACFESFILLGP